MSELREYTCVVCPNGCALQVKVGGDKGNKVLSVVGNICPRGELWARQEVENPLRTISTNVLVEGGTLPVTSVRTLDAVPLSRVTDVRNSLRSIVLHAPVHIGEIICEHPAGVPCRVSVTRNVPLASGT